MFRTLARHRTRVVPTLVVYQVLDRPDEVDLADSTGSVEPGKAADLVVVDADPLTDIGNTTRIHTVVARGHRISPRQRATMLADVAQAAAEG